MQTTERDLYPAAAFCLDHMQAGEEEQMHFIRKASLTVIACAMLLVVGTALAQAEDRFHRQRRRHNQ